MFWIWLAGFTRTGTGEGLNSDAHSMPLVALIFFLFFNDRKGICFKSIFIFTLLDQSSILGTNPGVINLPQRSDRHLPSDDGLSDQ